MSKRALKTRIATEQDGLCALSQVELAPALALVDTDRIRPKAHGGTYTDENTRIVEPRAHMARHGNLRDREGWLDALKTMFDDRQQFMKLNLKINNQILAYERRTDSPNPATVAFLKAQMEPIDDQLSLIDRQIEKALKTATDPLVRIAMAVPGMGAVTVAALTVYVDLAKAEHASSLWKYCGLDKASHERYEKGQTSGGNKTLRTIIWNTANSMMKNRDCAYREVYDRVKARLAASEKIVKSRNTAGKLVEVMWKDAKPGHRHGAALRAIEKHLLADYWFVGRTIKGLPAEPLYAEAVLGHTRIIKPKDRGWQY